MLRLVLAVLAWALLAAPSAAQWQVCGNCVPIGRGAGTGFTIADPAAAADKPLVSNGAALPTFKTLPVAGGGSGATALTANAILKGADTSPIVASGVSIDGSNNVTGVNALTGTGTALFRSGVNGGVSIFSTDVAPTQFGELSLGVNFAGGYQWIQGYNSRPLAINPIGNNVLVGRADNSVYKLDVFGAGTAAVRAESAGLVAGFWSTQAGSGTQETFSFNQLNISSDNIIAGTADASTGFVNGLTVDHFFGGSNATGGRNAVYGKLRLTSATSATNPYKYYAAVHGWGEATAPDGGTVGAEKGVLYGLGGLAHLLNGATNWEGVIGAEITTGIHPGASAAIRSALWLNGLGTTTGKGSVLDAILVLTNQAAAAKFNTGLLFSSNGGGDPIETTGTLIGTSGAKTVAKGIDFTSYTFTGNVFASPNFSVTGTGATTTASLASSGAITGASAAISGAITANSLTLSGAPAFAITAANVGPEIGSTSIANTPFIDFHASGNNIDYDVRLIASGGTASVGNGTLNITAGSLQVNGAAGITGTRTMRNAADTGSCTIVTTLGLVTGGTC